MLKKVFFSLLVVFSCLGVSAKDKKAVIIIVDGIPNTRTCVTRVKDGMQVKTQDGLGSFERKEGAK